MPPAKSVTPAKEESRDDDDSNGVGHALLEYSDDEINREIFRTQA